MVDTKLVIAFDARLGNIETAMARIDNQLKRTHDQAKQTNDSLTGLGRAFSTISPQAGRLGNALSFVGSGLGALAASLGAGLGLTAAVAGFMRLAESVGSLAERADQVGVSAAALQALRLEGLQFNVTAEGMDTALTRLTRAIGDAATGSDEALSKFNRLGVAVRNANGEVRGTEEVFREVAEAIGAMEDPAAKASAAVTLFGRSGQQLIPFFNDISQRNRDFVQVMRDTGAVISDEAISNFDRFGDALTVFNSRIRAVIAEALSPLAGLLADIIERLNGAARAAVAIRRVNEGNAQVGDLDTITQAIERQAAAVTELERRAELARSRGRPVPLNTQNALAAARQEQERLESERTRITNQAEQERTDRAAANAADRGRQVGELFANAEEAVRRSRERAAAARRGPEALREFEISEDARRLERQRLQEFRSRGLTPTDEDIQRIRTETEELARNNAVRAERNRTRPNREEERDIRRSINEAERLLDRVRDRARDPGESFGNDLDEITQAIATLAQHRGRLSEEQRNLLDSLNSNALSSGIEQNIERAVKAMQEAGDDMGTVERTIIERVTAFGQEMVRVGRITSDEFETLMQRTRATIGRTIEDNQSLGAGLRRGFNIPGAGDRRQQNSFEFDVGEGVGRELTSVFDELSSALNRVAEGSQKAGEAWRAFALSFAQSVLKIIAQAALLRAVQAIVGYFFPGGGVGVGGTSIAGSRMTGGRIAGGYSYLVGERGPEIFTPGGSGMITPNHMIGGGAAQVIVNQNAPGVVVESRRMDDGTVMLAVNLARQQVAADFRESSRTGYGPYAESMTQRYNLRRRM